MRAAHPLPTSHLIKSAQMANRYQRRNSRFQANPNFTNTYAPRHRPRPPPYQPTTPNHHGGPFIPTPPFSPDHHFQAMNSILTERAYLLSSLQREDVRATALLTVIADLNARMASGAPTRGKERRWLRRDLEAKRHAADVSVRQEKRILQRLGEVTLVIQQRERWWRVEREREMGMGSGTRMEVGTGGNAWGGWNGADVVSWDFQQVQYDGQSQGYYGGQEWVQQVPQPGYAMSTPPASTEGGWIIGCNDWQVQVPGSSDWQLPAPVDSSSDWNMSRVSGTDAMEQKPVRVARSDSMVEIAAGRRRAQSSMSMPDLSSRSWRGDCPQYLGYYSLGCSPEMTGGSVN